MSRWRCWRPGLGPAFCHGTVHVQPNSLRPSLDHLPAGLQKNYPSTARSVAVLTPYKAQVRKLRSAFAKSVAPAQLAAVEFATVDGFQVSYCPA